MGAREVSTPRPPARVDTLDVYAVLLEEFPDRLYLTNDEAVTLLARYGFGMARGRHKELLMDVARNLARQLNLQAAALAAAETDPDKETQ